MRGYFSVVFGLTLFFLVATAPAAKAQWFLPMSLYDERQTIKNFGQLINRDFYKGKEKLFPFNRFYGYHAGVDLEVLDSEKNKAVPVYAVHTGKIVYVGTLGGYGGVILQDLDSSNHTALYGHVKIKNALRFLNKTAEAGEIITYLGDEFSAETAKERKHLHFAIYKGLNLYFKGHEKRISDLQRLWENPTIFLALKGVVDPGEAVVTPIEIDAQPLADSKLTKIPSDEGLFFKVSEWLKTLFRIK